MGVFCLILESFDFFFFLLGEKGEVLKVFVLVVAEAIIIRSYGSSSDSRSRGRASWTAFQRGRRVHTEVSSQA